MVNEFVTTASPNMLAISDSRGIATRRLKIVPIITISAAPAMRPVVFRSRSMVASRSIASNATAPVRSV